jgi:hypothetical protein
MHLPHTDVVSQEFDKRTPNATARANDSHVRLRVQG